MRWDNLKVEAEEEHRLPGYRDAAVVRRFDAPEALDVRFYEVRAKSALNAVPKASRMPFRWTINPYRGCTHACTYCSSGDTEILMRDGRTRMLADLEVGDEIYGTVRQGVYRRYAPTEVLAIWSVFKEAFRITLEDGTELVTSGDHRLLTARGWKYVIGAEQGPLQRPHLTLNSKLMGTGQFERAPLETRDYRQGYLCGLIRGDGHLGTYEYTRAGRQREELHRFRLALTDLEALSRAREYLTAAGVETSEFAFKTAAGYKAMRAIRTQARAPVQAIRELVAWPRRGSDDWCKGFLAGIFDAEGSYSEALRISNTDPAIIDWITWCLRRLEFKYVVEDRALANGLKVVRLLGGLVEHLRFLQTVDPAITRKRSLAGKAVKTNARLRVVSIESLGVELPLYDITTGTGDFIANGVVSHNCFARPTHTYLDFNAGRDFEREIVVKVNVPEVLRTELARRSWRGEHVALGTNTDPYQWVEGRYKLMPGIWEAFRDFRNPCSVLTKSPLLLRDLPLMQEVAEVAPISANLSIPTIDEKAWRTTEPHTPNPRARMEAVAELNRAGIPTGILIAPLMPGINDAPEQVEEILELAAEAGAVSVGGIALHLRGEVRGIFFDWLRAHRPDLIPRYEQLYKRGAYAPPAERQRLQDLATPRGTESSPRRYIRDRDLARGAQRKPPDEPRPEPAQAALF
ncbi:MAG TPA: radical SAM protein [Candidatus Dormibacteraeota bacterium]|nr:radical SAM protein [Candidatus Dormibacteraeota bacterium]